MHTLYSDGILTPFELVQRAQKAGLRIIGITDHDSVGALDEAVEVGRELGVDVVPGAELSAIYDDQEIHILGYFVDYHDQTLLDALAKFREGRMRRAERIVGKLNCMNIPLSIASVLANVTGESVGRPHIATALVNGGHAESYHQAFHKYLGDGRPAFEKKENFTPEETIRLIAESGGLSFLAHPRRTISDEVITHLVKAGLDGIEVIHPSHTSELVTYYRDIVHQYFLLESGGSDFHGGLREDDDMIGQVTIPVSSVEVMRQRLNRQ